MKNCKKYIVSILAAALVGVMVFGAVNVGASSDTVQLDFWNVFTGDDGLVMADMVDEFNESHPGIQVQHIAMPAEADLYIKFPMVANDASQAPDLITCHSYQIQTYVENGFIQPISLIADNYESLAAENFMSEDIVEYEGERYGIPTDLPVTCIYGNTALIEQYCPEIIEDHVVTWDEIYALGAKLEEEGVLEEVKPLVSGWARNDILSSLKATGGYITEDTDTLALTPEMMTAAIEPWVELYNKGYYIEDGIDTMGMFSLGQAVFMTNGTWVRTVVDTYGFDYMMLPNLQMDADVSTISPCAHTFMLPNRSYTDAELEAIGTFIEWFEQHTAHWAESGALVTYIPTQESPEFQAMPQYGVISGGPGITSDVTYKYNNTVNEVINTYGFQCLYGYMSPEDYGKIVVSEIQSKINALEAE